MVATLSTTAIPSSAVVSLVVSELTIVMGSAPVLDVSLIVTTAADGLATVKSACALTAVKILSAVVSLLSFGLNPKVSSGAEPLDASDVKVIVVPFDFVIFKVVQTAILP